MASREITLERLRAQLVTILKSKGKTIADDAGLATAIPLVNSIGVNDNFKKLCEGSDFEINDTEEIITSFVASIFSGNSHLKKVNAPACSYVGNSAFYNNSSLAEITLSNNITNIGEWFIRASNVTELHLGTVGTIARGLSSNNPHLIHFSMTSCNSINMNYNSANGCAFYNNTALKIADFGRLETFLDSSTSNFQNCTSMKAVVLRKTDGVTTLSSTNVFNWLKTNVVDWHIYVPDELVDSYKAAANWSTFADYFAPLSEYDEEAILNGTAEVSE